MMPISICLSIGIASASFVSNHIFFIIIFFILILCVLWRRKNLGALPFVLILFGLAVTGRLLAQVSFREPASLSQVIKWSVNGPVVCDGVLLKDPQFMSGSWRLDVDLKACGENVGRKMEKAGGRVRLFAGELLERYEKGDGLRLRAKLSRPRRYKNPGSFDYRLYLLTQGIHATGSITGPKWIVKLGGSGSSWLAGLISKLRGKINKSISAVSSGEAAGLIKTITIGERSELSPETKEAFSRTGVAHLLAISGLHVGLVALLVFFLARLGLGWWGRLLLWRPLPYLAAVASLPLIWMYVAVADFPVSALRAALMISVFVIAFVLPPFRNDLWSSLATAVFVILIIYPLSIFAVSFQLSVAAVAVIIALVPPLLENIERFLSGLGKGLGRWCRPVLSLAAVTLAATIGTAPLMAYHFHYVTAAGLAANLIAVPLMGLVLLPLAMISSLISLVSDFLAGPIWRSAIFAADVLLEWVKYLDLTSSALIIDWAPSVTEVLFVFILLGLVIFWKRLPWKRATVVILALCFLIDVGYGYAKPIMQPEMAVTFLDVGQGDAVVVSFPNRRVMMIDGGGIKGSDFDVGTHIVVPALLSYGIHRMDGLILSHAHHDHYKGLAAVAKHYRPAVLYTNGGQAPEEEWADWQDFLAQIKTAGVSVETLSGSGLFKPALILEEGGARLEIYAPQAKDLTILNTNDASLIVRLSYGKHSFLFTGDMESVGEQIWLATNPNLAGDVLKVGHHGSETSSSVDFLKAVNPRIAVITAGEHNKYGFPDEVVVKRLEQFGAEVYRTDRDGAVTITTDGNSLSVDTFVKNPEF